MKHLVIFVPTGFEDVELIASLDVFQRNNISYDLFSVENLTEVKGKYEAIVKTKNTSEFNYKNYKGIFLPGGPGHKILLESDFVIEVLKKFESDKKIISAICAAPDVLLKADVIKENKITSFPGHAKINNNTQEEVVVSKNIVTGRDFKSTISFAEKLVEVLNA